jgi:hypothetical protein
MDNAVVLDGGIFSDADAAEVAAYHRARPDTGVFADGYFSHDIGGLADKCRRVYLRGLALDASYHCYLPVEIY